jgi:putative transposase
MTYDPDRHHRQSIRRKGYDYAQPGAYYVTLCTIGRMCLFGDVVDGVMALSELGKIVEGCWRELPAHYPHVVLDACVIMPNHVHAVIVLVESREVGADIRFGGEDERVHGEIVRPPDRSAPVPPSALKRHGLPEIVRAFKASATFRIRRLQKEPRFEV